MKKIPVDKAGRVFRSVIHSGGILLRIGLSVCVLCVGCGRSASTDTGSADGAASKGTGKQWENPGVAVQPGNADAVANPETPPGPFQFASMREQSGIDFLQTSGNSGDKPFPAANGTGCGILDIDMDGHPDLCFANGAMFPLRSDSAGPWDRLYRNIGQWKFRDISAVAGIGAPGYSCGLAVSDINSDGFPDLYVTRYGRNHLYVNHGDGTFEEAATAFGIADEHWGTSAAFGDFNHDGLADLYVCNYGQWTWETSQFCGDRARNIRMFCSPTHVPPEKDVLYENSGDGTFRDISAEAGIQSVSGRGQGVIVADLDADGRMDIYVANDIHPNFLFANEEDHFQEIGEQSGTAFDHVGQAQAGMGLAIADVDANGTLDLFVTNYQNEHNALYNNLGQRTFLETGLTAIPEGSLPWVGWGTSFADFDLDGWSDLIVTNGHTDDNLAELGREGQYAQPPGVWRNTAGQFQLASNAGSYFRQLHVGRGLAVADMDSDGDTDVVISHQDSQPELLRNDSCSAQQLKSGLSVRLIGRRSHRDAVAAVVTAEADGQQRTSVIYGGGSYASASDKRLMIGMPGNGTVSLVVRWPDGTESQIKDLPRGGHYIIVQEDDPNAGTRVLTDF